MEVGFEKRFYDKTIDNFFGVRLIMEISSLRGKYEDFSNFPFIVTVVGF